MASKMCLKAEPSIEEYAIGIKLSFFTVFVQVLQDFLFI